MLLPIVDENDVQVGVKERNDLLKEDIYRVSSVWITDSAGRYLLAQRALTKKKNPGKWGPAAAGTVEEGETYESNIVKEIDEELGIQLSLQSLRKGPKIKRVSPIDTYFSQWYFAVVDKELEEFTFPEDEVMALQWFTEEELRAALVERPDEFLPIIHENVEKILSNATSDISETYTKGAACFILQDNQILLTLRKREPYPGYWEVPAGKQEEGESFEETAVREVKEETGLNVEVIREIDVVVNHEMKFHSHMFLAKVVSGELGNLQPEEHSEVRFFPLNALPEKVGSSTLRGLEIIQQRESGISPNS